MQQSILSSRCPQTCATFHSEEIATQIYNALIVPYYDLLQPALGLFEWLPE